MFANEAKELFITEMKDKMKKLFAEEFEKKSELKQTKRWKS